MTWVRIDDQFTDHPKVVKAGPLAGWLYMCGLTYASRYLTDGFIPAAQVPRLADLPNADELAGRLVGVGLWEPAEGGYQIHDYLGYQPSAEKVKAQRAETARRQSEWRDRERAKREEEERNGVTNSVTNAERNAVTNASVTGAPYPSRSRTPAGTHPEPTLPAGEKTGGVGGADAPLAADAAPPSGKQGVPKLQERPREFEGLRACFEARGMRAPPLVASAEQGAARRLLKLAGDPDLLVGCFQDIRAGEYGDSYAQQHLSFVYLERQNRFENWRAWKEGDGGEPQRSPNGRAGAGRRSQPGPTRAASPFAKYG